MNIDLVWVTLRSWIHGVDAAHLHFIKDTLLSMTLRGTVVLFLVLGIVRVWRRASAAQLHLAWMIACGIMIAIPVYRSIAPKWEAPILQPVETAPMLLPSAAVEVISQSKDTATTQLSAGDFPVLLAMLGIWSIGSLTAFVLLVLSHIRARRLIRQSVKTTDSRVLYILSDIQRSLLPNRNIEIRQSKEAMPITYGTLSPVILLPSDLACWSDERLQNVLIHELAHIKRFDCLSHTIALSICAIQWFNPLMWYAVFQLKALREEACDNYVLTSGYRPSRYATHLLDIVETLRGSSGFQLSSASFVRQSRIQQRLQAIMNVRRVRTHVSWKSNMAAAVLTGIIAIPLSAFSPVPRAAEPSTMAEIPKPSTDNSAQKQDPRLIEGNAYLADHIPKLKTNPSMIKKITPIAAGALLAASSAQADTMTMQRDSMVLSDSIEALSGGTISVANGLKLLHNGVPINSVKIVTNKPPLALVNPDPIVILNGVRMPQRSSDKNNGKSALEMIDPKSIESIEVVRGPVAVRLYGPEAAAGAIVVKTKKTNSR